MKRNTLGRTNIEVSALCLGSMTWGTQNSEAEAHDQIHMALDHGINFIDTAEMYPTTPLSAETQGNTERIIGSWFAKYGRRDEMVLATKVSGSGYRNVREGIPISSKTIHEALDNSLKSLQSDYVDLYQLHWPNRGSYHFRQNWRYDASGQDTAQAFDHMEDVLTTMDELIKTGKVRAVGLSNETAWGTQSWLRLSEERSLPRMATLQNEYSLLCRNFDTDLAETCHHEDVGLICFSPLAAGMLTGKYLDGRRPKGSRADVSNASLGNRWTDNAHRATAAYMAIAANHGVDPVQMALAWAMARPFMASVIFGATSQEQLANSLKSADLKLSQEILNEIDDTHRQHPMPY